MKERLKQIIEYKTGGRKGDFCRILGWTQPYLTKLLKGVDFGLRPVVSILSTFPEINARWFLLGTGSMLNEEKYASVHRAVQDRVLSLLDMEKYLPVMAPDELHKFEHLIITGGTPDFRPEVVTEWDRLLAIKEKEMEDRFADARAKMKLKGCNRKIANK